MKRKVKNSRKNKEFIEIYGFHAVKAALKNNNRKHQKLTITKNNKDNLDNKLLHNLNEIIELPIQKINKFHGNENTHQGIILKTSKIVQPSLEEIINNTNKDKEIIVMLDHVCDPHNIGSIMRSCALFNCKSIVLAKNNSPEIKPEGIFIFIFFGHFTKLCPGIACMGCAICIVYLAHDQNMITSPNGVGSKTNGDECTVTVMTISLHGTGSIKTPLRDILHLF